MNNKSLFEGLWSSDLDQMLNEVLSLENINKTLQNERDRDSWDLEYITEGILLTTISIFGFIGNIMSVYVLLRPSVREIFSNILTGLATFDALFLLCAIATFGLPVLSKKFYKKTIFPHILPACYGLSHIFRVGSAFATLSVTLERFFAIVFPLKDFNCIKKWLLPLTTTFTFLFNIPKFFEVEMDPDYNVVGTELRNHPTYFKVYGVWMKLILTELVPYISILILNSFIIIKIAKSARFRRRILKRSGKFRRNLIRRSGSIMSLNGVRPYQSMLRNIQSQYTASGNSEDCRESRSYFEKQRQEHRLGILLVSISILYITCQSFKIIPDVYELIFCRNGEECFTSTIVMLCTNLSHLLVCFNSSANCVIYLLVGRKFRQVWFETFCPRACCRQASNSGTDQIPMRTWTFKGRARQPASPQPSSQTSRIVSERHHCLSDPKLLTAHSK